ncbi:MAG: undecaprenyldiphospho-muramoylpentapeptide beta-N-acetylglucosaminyltransferase [Acidobacteria bacterium]|nr:undecaprenyldiphospho-muramoylpentapeptide beta-N-acetylglucosaminyltransferase [Acidobacteriota bacterium]
MMVGGATGGHVFPALAVAAELRRRGSSPEIAFVGVEEGVEARVVPAAGYPLYTVPAARFRGAAWGGKARSLWLLAHSTTVCTRLFDQFRPNVLFGVGGYASAPAMLAAVLSQRATVLFEPNAGPGLANRLLAPLATRVAVAYEETVRFFDRRAVRTGTPVREEFFRVARKQHLPPFTLLIFGGSQGALAINAAVIDALDRLRTARPELRFIHQTGQRDFEAVRTAYARRGIPAEVHPFIDNMAECFAQADLILCRAGASALAELAAAGKAAILVPYPHAADQHQLRNAELLVRAGAARMMEQRELTGERLAGDMLHLLEHPEHLGSLEERVRAFAVPDAAARIADLIESVAR